MFKRLATIFSMTILVLESTVAFAIQEQHDFDVSVTVPTSAFYVLPADPGWIHQEQRLPWNLAISTLGSLRKQFDVKHDAGAIEARLEGRPYLSNGNDDDDISLAVSFNKIPLSEVEAQKVVTVEEGISGKRVLLEIVPAPPSDGIYKAGNYYGSVNIIFNAVLPGLD